MHTLSIRKRSRDITWRQSLLFSIWITMGTILISILKLIRFIIRFHSQIYVNTSLLTRTQAHGWSRYAPLIGLKRKYWTQDPPFMPYFTPSAISYSFIRPNGCLKVSSQAFGSSISCSYLPWHRCLKVLSHLCMGILCCSDVGC